MNTTIEALDTAQGGDIPVYVLNDRVATNATSAPLGLNVTQGNITLGDSGGGIFVNSTTIWIYKP